MSKYTLCFLFLALTTAIKADSPLTSTNPARAYKNVPIVAAELADEVNELSAEECTFLFESTNPLDHKFAFINALGWGDSTHVETYVKFLMEKYRLPHAVFDSIITWRGTQPGAYAPAAPLKADDYACLAYLQAMGDYFRPLRAYYCAYHAVDLKPESGAAAYIIGLVMAQFYLDSDWCKVYDVMAGIRGHEGFTEDILRPEAIENIFEYIDIYQEACAEKKKSEALMVAGGYHKPEHPQLLEDKKNYVDLEVVSIAAPEYISEIQGSRVVVKIRNKGTISNIETDARLSDLDITAAEAKKRKFEKNWISAIAENNSNANGEASGPDVQQGVDSDKNWEVIIKIPVLQPGEETELIFELHDHWIYDPNCEIEVELDHDQNIQERNEENNRKAYVAWG